MGGGCPEVWAGLRPTPRTRRRPPSPTTGRRPSGLPFRLLCGVRRPARARLAAGLLLAGRGRDPPPGGVGRGAQGQRVRVSGSEDTPPAQPGLPGPSTGEPRPSRTLRTFCDLRASADRRAARPWGPPRTQTAQRRAAPSRSLAARAALCPHRGPIHLLLRSRAPGPSAQWAGQAPQFSQPLFLGL